MTLPRAPLALLALAAGALVLAGCGGDDAGAGTTATARSAAASGTFPDGRTCPERSPSFDWDGRIINRLAAPVQLAVGDYTCDDWSGASTPGAVMNGTTIAPNASTNVRLEPRRNRNRQWTMEVKGADGGTSFGRARVYLKTATIEPFMSTPDQGAYERTWTNMGDTVKAMFLPLGDTGAADTPTSLLPTASTTMGIVVHQGRVALVTEARVTG